MTERTKSLFLGFVSAATALFTFRGCAVEPSSVGASAHADRGGSTAGSLGVSTVPFPGPFSSWIDVKRDGGARGDGTTDDTAAVQNALNRAGHEDGKPSVVYFPAGTYRITSTLQLKYQAIAVLGDDPNTTILRWDGPADRDMLLANGVARSRFGRIRFDGAARAGGGLHFSWDAVGPGSAATMAVDMFDLAFVNIQKCIIGGSLPPGEMDSDIGIFRTRFEKCSVAGLSTESPNAVDYWVRDSLFVDNARGLTNEFGDGQGGSFNVHGSVFRNSTIADVTVTHYPVFLGVRDSTSIGSNRFVSIQPDYMAYAVTLQNNTVLNTVNPVAIDANYQGDLILLDNRIRSRRGASGPAVLLNAGGNTADLLSVGNTYTVSNAESVSGGATRIRRLDDRVVPYDAIDGTIPPLPPLPPRSNGDVIEVPAGASSDVLQQAIDRAATRAGTHPIVHVAPGAYHLTRTLVIPANLDVVLSGDGTATTLWGEALAGGPLIRLLGPSKAVLQDMKLNASMSSDGHVVTSSEAIAIDGADQPDARIYGELLELVHNTQVDVLADRLSNAHMNFQGLLVTRTGPYGVQSIGTGEPKTSRIVIRGGTFNAWANPGGSLYRVTNQGSIVVEDAWYEGANGPTLARLDASSSGTFTLNGGLAAQFSGASGGAAAPVLDINGFSGRATVLGALLAFAAPDPNRHVTIANENAQTHVLLSGLVGKENRGNAAYIRRFGSGGTVSIFSNKVDTESDVGNVALPDIGAPTNDNELRSMLEELRATRTETITDLPGGTTDVRLYRLMIQYATNGIHARP
ncbi:glycosyl hydrolase family 28-related protein [Pendulispora albinea]|uniref:Glycoside hydrolase family 55 protein n=1 Tax=Pendulispora albinea TaxID=2741071 RepID=A0ABZ2LZW5_9BACT